MISTVVREYKNRIIEGVCLDLVPLSATFSEDIAALRNREENRYNLNQDYELTKEMQDAWTEAYLDRDDDLYWCLVRKDGQFLGTIRLYEIKEDEKTCRQGSFMVDKDYAAEGPYALEAIILTLDFAFEKLLCGLVYNDDRCDNKVMNNLSKKFGFSFVEEISVKGVPYNLYSVAPDAYEKKREKIKPLIDYWKER